MAVPCAKDHVHDQCHRERQPSFRKVTKKGAFPNEDAVFKIFYLRIQELYKKWKGRHVANWAMVRNQLLMDDRMSQLMQQYDVAY